MHHFFLQTFDFSEVIIRMDFQPVAVNLGVFDNSRQERNRRGVTKTLQGPRRPCLIDNTSLTHHHKCAPVKWLWIFFLDL